MKGVNVLISWVMVIAIVIAGIGIVTLGSSSVLEQTQASVVLTQAEYMMTHLNNAIQTVSREGIGSSRLIQIPNMQGMWQFIPEEDMIEFRMTASPLETLTRQIQNSITLISGFDANCSQGSYGVTPALILENSYIKVYLQKIGTPEAHATLDTVKNILAIESKTTGKTIVPTDSSIQIDSIAATASGTGFSEMRTGTLPKCRAHFFVNTSSMSYDIFYTLYSGADFIAVEVRNIS